VVVVDAAVAVPAPARASPSTASEHMANRTARRPARGLRVFSDVCMVPSRMPVVVWQLP
jgi:hypothetical protein